MSSYAFANPLPWWGITLALLACAAVAWFAYVRFRLRSGYRNLLIALRFVNPTQLVSRVKDQTTAGAH